MATQSLSIQSKRIYAEPSPDFVPSAAETLLSTSPPTPTTPVSEDHTQSQKLCDFVRRTLDHAQSWQEEHRCAFRALHLLFVNRTPNEKRVVASKHDDGVIVYESPVTQWRSFSMRFANMSNVDLEKSVEFVRFLEYSVCLFKVGAKLFDDKASFVPVETLSFSSIFEQLATSFQGVLAHILQVSGAAN